MEENAHPSFVLDAATIRARFRDYGLMAHMQVATMMMGGIYAFAAIVLIDILRSPDRPLVRLSFWSLGVATEMMALARQMQRPLLLTRASTSEIPLLVFHGTIVLAAFALVGPSSGGPDGWRYVYLIGLGMGFSAWLIMYAFMKSAARQSYGEELRAAVDAFLKHQRRFMRRLMWGYLPIALILFAITRFALIDVTVSAVFVIGSNVAMMIGVGLSYTQHERDFQKLEAAIEAATTMPKAPRALA